jgi:hypothetical protein
LKIMLSIHPFANSSPSHLVSMIDIMSYYNHHSYHGMVTPWCLSE